MQTEILLPVAVAVYNVTGSRPSPSTVSRWICQGLRMPRGSVVRLDSAKVGGRRRTSEKAVSLFVLRCTIESRFQVPKARA